MDEDSLLLANIEDKIEQAFNKNMVTYSRFMDVRQRALAESVCRKHKELKVFFYGGYPEAERTVGIFLPDYIKAGSFTELLDYFTENPEENPLMLLRISKDSFSTLSHRDYLGSMMGLGIKREMIGDILVREDGCDIVLLKSIVKFLEDNLQKAGRGTLSTEITGVESIIVPPQKTQDKLCIVSSLRLDSAVSAAYNISRTLAAEAINKGVVSVNGLQTQKIDAKIAQGDKIVLRGKGKVVVKELAGETKKGKIKLIFQKFI
ncbi:MAG: YlmH/Sll1252 family protein [Eubacteriales bacterium]